MTKPLKRTHGRSITALAALAALAMGCKSGSSANMRHGGTELVYSVVSNSGDTSALTRVRNIVDARLHAMKIPAAVIVDGDKLKVRVPKSVDADQLADVKKLAGLQGRVEFREVDDGAMLKAIAASLPADGDVEVTQEVWDAGGRRMGTFVVMARGGEEVGRKALAAIADFKMPPSAKLLSDVPSGRGTVHMYALHDPVLTLDDVRSVSAPKDPYLPPEVSFQFNEAGAKTFREFTERIIGRKMAIVVDGIVRQTEVVVAPVTVGRASLAYADEGDRKVRQHEAEVLATALRSGMLPVPIKLDEERAVSPN